MNRKVFLLNVGANCSHGNLRSPIFPDGRFEFFPIPEVGIASIETKVIPRYCDLFTKEILPKSYLNRLVHDDPEFESFTYGDYPTKSPRVSVLRHARKEDLLFFIARLVRYSADSKRNGEAGFYLIGFFELEEILRNVESPLKDHELAKFGRNAHVRRGMLDREWYNGFWLFKGGKGSRKFDRAILFNRDFCDIMRDRYGQPWVWKNNRSDLQTIGSYTRSCRLIDDQWTVDTFLAKINEALVKGVS